MPNKERYAKDKQYYQSYHSSESYKAIDAAKKMKRISDGKCLHCGKIMVEGACSKCICVNCADASLKRIQMFRSMHGIN